MGDRKQIREAARALRKFRAFASRFLSAFDLEEVMGPAEAFFDALVGHGDGADLGGASVALGNVAAAMRDADRGERKRVLKELVKLGIGFLERVHPDEAGSAGAFLEIEAYRQALR